MLSKLRATMLTACIAATLLAGWTISVAQTPSQPRQRSSQTTLIVTATGTPIISVASKTAVTLTATTSSIGSPLTVGQVNFCDATAKHCTDIHLLGSAQLTAAGTATFKYIPSIGAHQYQAVFVGTNNDAQSISNVAPLAVTGIEPTATQLVAIGVPGDYRLIADVYAFGGATPGPATIPFLDTTNGNYLFGTAPLSLAATALFNSSSPSLPGITRGVALADVNGDGILDLLADSGNSMQVLFGKGDGSFTLGPSSPTGNAPEYFAVGDFNSDGILDVAVPNYSDNTVSILLGNGDGTFRTSQTVPHLGVYTYKVTVADFNGDGIQDLAVTDTAAVTVYMLLGNGDGTFRSLAPFPIDTPGSTSGGYSVAADFNGDGKMDLAVAASETQGEIVIMLGNGDGTFKQQPLSACPAFLSDSFAVADFNGDGIPDLVAGAGDEITFSSLNETVVLLGNGDGTFTLSQTIDTGATSPVHKLTYGVAVGDFNGDGIPDFAVTTLAASGGAAGNTVTLFLGQGDGTFLGSVEADTGELPLQVAVADINSDGLADVITGNFSSQDVDVFLTANGATAMVDVTGISPVGTGTHYAQATYPGTVDTLPSASNLVPLIAQRMPTMLELLSYPANPQFNQPVTLVAILSPITAQGHNAGGTVTFTLQSGAILGSASIVINRATLNLSALPVGEDCVVATYNGDMNFAPSASFQSCFVVGPPPAIVRLTTSPNPVFLQHAVTLTAMISDPIGSTATPTGTATFEDGNTPLGTTAVSGGIATFTISTLALGPHSLTAVYNGNSQLSASPSPVVVEFVEDFALTALIPNVTIHHGGMATYSLTLQTVGGTVTADAVGLSITGAPDSSIVTLSPTTIAAGSPATPIMLTIQTPNYPVGPWNAASSRSGEKQILSGENSSRAVSEALGCFWVGAGLLVLGRKRRRLRAQMKYLVCLLMLAAGVSLSGCGSGWKTQQYTILVTSTSGNLVHTTTLILTTECADGQAACPITH